MKQGVSLEQHATGNGVRDYALEQAWSVRVKLPA